MDEVIFEPFQKVLVRYDDECTWSINFYERKCGEHHKCLSTGRWMQCIPYEGNERLLGTTDSPTPPKPEFTFGDKVEVSDDGDNWIKALYVTKNFANYHNAFSRKTGLSSYTFCRHADW